MASSKDWAEAFLRCAAEDLEAAKELLASGTPPPGTLAMLFQMAFEKIGKAYLIAHRGKRPEQLRTHKAASVALWDIRQDTDWLWERGHRGQQWTRALLAVKVLEEAQPAVASRLGKSEMLEYPWEDAFLDRVITAKEGIPMVRDISQQGTTLASMLVKLGLHLMEKLR